MSLRIVVSGMMAANPHQGGATWAVLQYVLGLRQLGHDVWFIEPMATAAVPHGVSLATSVPGDYFRDVVKRFALADRAALLRQETHETAGLPFARLEAAADRADLLINISGMLTTPALFDRIPVRVYLDLDPAFNQLWHAVEGIDMRFAGHTHFVTVGLRIGTAGCDVPTCGLSWIRTLQPIVLEHWPAQPPNPHRPWTTVGNWRGYGSITHQGALYGQKAHSMRQLLDVPRRTGDEFRLALAIHPDETDDLQALSQHGWQLVDAARACGTPDAYRDFIADSKAEFGVAKSGYVISRCGWFSDRSVCYLASGRPVLAQDTGFQETLPTGCGLLIFATEDEAVAGVRAIDADYPRHAAAARAIAEEYFDSNRVLPALLDAVAA